MSTMFYLYDISLNSDVMCSKGSADKHYGSHQDYFQKHKAFGIELFYLLRKVDLWFSEKACFRFYGIT